ncbi:hypothetical protein BDZ45DRAFT_805374 [Acephala macrosclerotiorum]|nr:hypothetical protein BDZ45DRAFT_805374 [Acephala macrosclerotiorum]
MTNQELKRKRIAVKTDPRKKHQKDKPTFSDPTALVTFVIGPSDNSTTFLVHKELVFNKCEVFAAAFSSTFTEGQTQIFKIEDTTEAAFRFLVQWIYSDRLEVFQLEDHRKEIIQAGVGDAKRVTNAEWDIVLAEDQALAETWVLADKFCLPILQNLVIKYMSKIAILRLDAPTWTFKYVYENTGIDSALRRFCILSVAAHISQSVFKKFPERYPLEMLIDFGAFMLGRAGEGIDDDLQGEMEKCIVPVP